MTRPSLAGLTSTEDYLIDEHLNFMFEIDAALVLPLLPPGVTPREAAYGLALVNVGYMRFDATHIGGRPDCIELTSSILINPDLSLDMQIPRLCVYDFRIGSNDPVFLAHEDEHQKLPGIVLPGLERRLDDTGGHLEVWDDYGPILEFRNTNPDPIFRREKATGQYVARHDGGLWQGVFQWDGVGCEQQHPGDAGRLYPHTLFRELPVDAIGDCFIQMFLPPGEKVAFRSFVPRRLA